MLLGAEDNLLNAKPLCIRRLNWQVHRELAIVKDYVRRLHLLHILHIFSPGLADLYIVQQ